MNFRTYILEGLFLLFQLSVNLGELFLGLIEVVLNLLDLLLEGTRLFLALSQERTVRAH